VPAYHSHICYHETAHWKAWFSHDVNVLVHLLPDSICYPRCWHDLVISPRCKQETIRIPSFHSFGRFVGMRGVSGHLRGHCNSKTNRIRPVPSFVVRQRGRLSSDRHIVIDMGRMARICCRINCLCCWSRSASVVLLARKFSRRTHPARVRRQCDTNPYHWQNAIRANSHRKSSTSVSCGPIAIHVPPRRIVKYRGVRLSFIVDKLLGGLPLSYFLQPNNAACLLARDRHVLSKPTSCRRVIASDSGGLCFRKEDPCFLQLLCKPK